MQISLHYMELCGRYGQKRAKNGEKTQSVSVFEFRRATSRHAGVAAENIAKVGPKISFFIFGIEGYDYLGS